jgi:type II secretory pathway component PulC
MHFYGIQIQQVIGTSWTDATIFQRGDFIQAINGQQMNAVAEVFLVLEKAIPFGRAEVTVLRGSKLLTYDLKL